MRFRRNGEGAGCKVKWKRWYGEGERCKRDEISKGEEGKEDREDVCWGIGDRSMCRRRDGRDGERFG